MGKTERNHYSLTWTFQFPKDGDTCYFAHCYPYTYTDLQVTALVLVSQFTNFCRGRPKYGRFGATVWLSNKLL